MKKTGMLWLCLLIGSAAAVGAAPAGEPGKSVTVLFQDALYQEQTAGDLDKAIELYQKVLDEAGQTEKLAAKAAYQLGMCYLKKDDKAKAAEYFKTVVTKYGTQKDLANDARKQLEQVAPQTGPEGGVFAKLPEPVLVRLSTLYGQLSAEAGEKSLFSNCHIHYIDTEMRRYSGGLGYFQNTLGTSIQQKVRLSGSGSTDLVYYDIAGRKMNTDIVKDESRDGYYHVYWLPDEPLAPRQIFMYGWSSSHEGAKLQSPLGGNAYVLPMQNFFGEPVLETFFLVLPQGVAFKDASEDFTDKEIAGDCTIYYWKKEVPEKTNHVVTATLSLLRDITPEELAKIVEKAVTTISTCTETDPRVKQSLDTLKGIKNDPVVAEISKYLDSETDTIRRSAIYVLWQGGFGDISQAKDKLIALCSHKENLTRGMAALAIGQAKLPAGYDTLAKMTTDDPDGYARRCGAYALGLFGDSKALPVLQKALQDKDVMVQQNAQAAITMLTKAAEPQKPAKRTKPDKLRSEDLAAEGWKLWQARKLTEAEQKFEEAAAADPGNENAWQGLGWSQQNQGKTKNAEASFKKCLEINPRNSAALNGLGWMAYNTEQKEEAVKYWEKAIKAQPGATAALNGLCTVAMENEDYQKAIRYYKMWLKVEPDSQDAKAGLEKATQLLSEKK